MVPFVWFIDRVYGRGGRVSGIRRPGQGRAVRDLLVSLDVVELVVGIGHQFKALDGVAEADGQVRPDQGTVDGVFLHQGLGLGVELDALVGIGLALGLLDDGVDARDLAEGAAALGAPAGAVVQRIVGVVRVGGGGGPVLEAQLVVAAADDVDVGGLLADVDIEVDADQYWKKVM